MAVIHLWEASRDNSIDWDDAFSRVPTEGVLPFTRRDTQHANPDHRPTQEQYERHIWLVQLFRSLNRDNEKLHDASPFRVVDSGFNAILFRSCLDLADLAEALGEGDIARASRRRAEAGGAALEALWSDEHDQYLCLDRVTGELVQSPSVGGLIAAFARIPRERLAAIAARIERLGEPSAFIVPSHDPSDSRFDGLRYWRGPCRLIVNYLIADGLREAGQQETASKIISNSLALINQSGFSEYYDPNTGEPCGGSSFTWTAAMVIEFLNLGDPASLRLT